MFNCTHGFVDLLRQMRRREDEHEDCVRCEYFLPGYKKTSVVVPLKFVETKVPMKFITEKRLCTLCASCPPRLCFRPSSSFVYLCKKTSSFI